MSSSLLGASPYTSPFTKSPFSNTLSISTSDRSSSSSYSTMQGPPYNFHQGHSPNMSDSLSPRVSVATDNSLASLWHRFEQMKKSQNANNELVEELLCRYAYLSEQHKKECEDHEREREYNRSIQRTRKNLEDENRNLKECLSQDPFILVLIDGDGMIFRDDLLQQGLAGGSKAAELLQQAINEYINERAPNQHAKFKVVAQVFANLKGLADTCVRAGIVDTASQVEDFARGFTRGNSLFNFIDVGYGKDRADDKLGEILKFHLHDYRCKQILFGCSHDNGYARLLEKLLQTDKAHVDRITLLEGVPFEKELAILPFLTHRPEDLFRITKINIYQPNGNPFIAPFPAAPGVRPLQNGTAMQSDPQLNLSHAPPRSGSVSTASSDFPILTKETSAPPPAATWATAAQKAAALPDTAPLPPLPKPGTTSATNNPPTIPRNRKGQRIDPSTKTYDKEEVNRVKRLKMCNVHFLRAECPYGDECTHVHKYKPTKGELETLRLVARMAPCQYGSGCEDPKCIYGHRCPAPEAKRPTDRGKTCIFGSECRFPPEMHGMDTNVVRMTKV